MSKLCVTIVKQTITVKAQVTRFQGMCYLYQITDELTLTLDNLTRQDVKAEHGVGPRYRGKTEGKTGRRGLSVEDGENGRGEEDGENGYEDWVGPPTGLFIKSVVLRS